MGATTDPLASSVRATTAYESAFRVDYRLMPARSPRIVALDEGADRIVIEAAALEWESATFYTSRTSVSGDDVLLHGVGGDEQSLREAIVDVDAVILVATEDTNSEVAARIGDVCAEESIIVAGLVIGQSPPRETVASLRPYARILLVSRDEDDLQAILVAIRA